MAIVARDEEKNRATLADVRALGPVKLKGKSAPTMVFELLSLTDPGSAEELARARSTASRG